jgi:hypothetical protein
MTHVCRLCGIEYGHFTVAFNCCAGLNDEEIREKDGVWSEHLMLERT